MGVLEFTYSPLSSAGKSPFFMSEQFALKICAYAVLGMFMDAIGMLLLTLPVVYPAVIALNGGEGVTAAEPAFGVSGVGCSIWFGIIVVKKAELCLITPPIGLNCSVVAGFDRNALCRQRFSPSDRVAGMSGGLII